MKKQKRVKFSIFEKKLYSISFLCLVFSIIIQIFFGANVGNLSITVEKLKYEITTVEKENEGLTMIFNEMTAFSNVKEVVKELGLSYNSDNIINITK
ncbi:MAG: hypothetical protein R3Y21_04205 [Mycoplasmatota bacterium]